MNFLRKPETCGSGRLRPSRRAPSSKGASLAVRQAGRQSGSQSRVRKQRRGHNAPKRPLRAAPSTSEVRVHHRHRSLPFAGGPCSPFLSPPRTHPKPTSPSPSTLSTKHFPLDQGCADPRGVRGGGRPAGAPLPDLELGGGRPGAAPYLPADKQFLVTRRALPLPRRRARQQHLHGGPGGRGRRGLASATTGSPRTSPTAPPGLAVRGRRTRPAEAEAAQPMTTSSR